MVPVAVLYRLSTMKQARRKAGDEVDIPGQRNAVLAFLRTRPDWHLVTEYEEKGVSAFKISVADRDVLQDAFRDAAAGRWRVLILFKADRLSRRSLEYPMVLDQLQRLNVEVWSVADAPGGKRLALENQMDKLVRFIEGWQAESESTNTSIRVAARMRQLAESGRWTGGRVPFGYRLVQVKDSQGNAVLRGGRVVQQLEPHPEHALVVSQVFARYSAGQGLRTIAGWLNDSGIPTCGGRQWWKHMVGRMVTNPLYVGMLAYNNRRVRSRQYVGEPILVKGQHQPIIDQDTWERTVALREARAKLRPKTRYSKYPLTGVLRCGLCGGFMGGMTRTLIVGGQERPYPAYKCLAGALKGTCSGRTVTARLIEANFVAALEQLEQPSALRLLLEEQSSERESEQARLLESRGRAQEQLQVIRRAIDRLNRGYLETGTLGDDEYRQLKAMYGERARALEAEIERPLPATKAPDYGALTEAARQIRANWPEMTVEERKAFTLSFCAAYDLDVVVTLDKSVELRPKGVVRLGAEAAD